MLGENKVFTYSELETLNTKYKELYEEAIGISQDIRHLISSLNNISIPDGVNSNTLRSILTNAQPKTDLFYDTLNKLNHYVERICNDLSQYDQKSAKNMRDLRSTTTQIQRKIKNYEDLIQLGFKAGNATDFTNHLLQIKEKAADIQDSILKVLEMSKGLALSSMVYSVDPVNMGTGNFCFEKEDLSINGIMPIMFKRTYNAIDDYCGVLGCNWVHNYEVYLRIKGKSISIMREDGCIIYFDKKEGDYYYSTLEPSYKLLHSEEGYQLIDNIFKSYQFDKDGRLITLSDENNNSVRFTYNNNKLLEKVESISGNLIFRYNSTGLLISVTDNNNRSIKYDYSGNKLTKIISTDGHTTRYEYCLKGKLNAIINPHNSVLVRNNYDDAFRTIKQVFADGGVMDFEYLDHKNQIKLTEQNGNIIYYEHDNRYRNNRIVYEDGEEIYTYNKYNRKTSYIDKNKHITKYEYDKNQNLIQIVNPLGETLSFGYDSTNHPIQVKQNNGGTYQIKYNKKGDYEKIIDPLGYETTLIYSENSELLKLIQPNGAAIEFEYDENGNISKIEYPNGGIYSYQYDKSNQVIQTINPSGSITKYAYNKQGYIRKVTNAEGKVRRYTYNELGKVIRIKDFDNTVLRTEYNSIGKMAKMINRNGAIYEYEYDLMWNISKVTEPNGAETCYLYNKLNKLTSIKNGKGYEIKYEYDPNGNRIIEDYEGRTRLFAYDALNRIIEVTDEEDAITKFEYNDMGHIQKLTDSLNNETNYEYDILGQLIGFTDTLGNKTTYTYTSMGLLESIRDALGGLTLYDYNNNGWLTSITYPEGEKESYTYDLCGNIIEKRKGEYSVFHYHYDNLDRIIEIINPLNGSYKFKYDAIGNVIWYNDAEGNETNLSYSPIGKLTNVMDAKGSVTSYEYDLCGNLTEIAKCGGVFTCLNDAMLINSSNHTIKRTRFEYDLLHNVSKVIDSKGQEESYQYDEFNRIVQKQDAEKYSVNVQYTPAGQIKQINYSDGQEVKFTYNALKQLTEIQDWIGITKITRNSLGNPIKVVNPDQSMVKYNYNSLGSREQLVYPNGREINYKYNHSGKLVQLSEKDQSFNYTYDNNGRLTDKKFPNGLISHYDYNAFDQIRSVVSRNDNAILEQYDYKYNNSGNPIELNRLRQDMQEDTGKYFFEYDALNRLEKVQSNDQTLRMYTYDDFGNRIQKWEQGGTINYQYNELNQLISENGAGIETEYKYDKRGNIIAEISENQLVKQYFYGASNMLNEYWEAGGSRTLYEYDGTRNRTGQTQYNESGDVQKLQYILDYTRPFHNILERRTGEETEQYLWDNRLLEQSGEGYYFEDIIGTPTRITDKNGKSVKCFSFDEFGNINSKYDSNRYPFGFTGYQLDHNTGLYYAQARYYKKEHGRFISKDPLIGSIYLPESIHAYTYGMNNPIMNTDETGMIAPLLVAIGVMFVVGAVGGTAGQVISDVIDTSVSYAKTGEFEWKISSWETYVGSALGGGIGGVSSLFVSPFGAGVIGSASSTFIGESLEKITGKEDRPMSEILKDTAVSGAIGGVVSFGLDKIIPNGGIKIQGITSGRNSYTAVFKSGITKLLNQNAARMSWKVLKKGIIASLVSGIIPSSTEAFANVIYEGLEGEIIKMIQDGLKQKEIEGIRNSYENIFGVSANSEYTCIG